MVFTAVRLIRTGTRETHHGQENTLHKKAGYIDADCSRPSVFLLQSRGGPYIVARFLGSVTWSLADHGNPSPSVRCGLPTNHPEPCQDHVGPIARAISNHRPADWNPMTQFRLRRQIGIHGCWRARPSLSTPCLIWAAIESAS